MNRLEFLERLKLAAPALAKREIMLMLTNFAFDGQTVSAFNDEIGIRLPCKVPFTGMVRGDILISMLSNSRAKELEIEAGDNSIQIKAASAKFKLPLMVDGMELFEFPKPDKAHRIGDDDEFVACVAQVLPFCANNGTVPEHLGVTIEYGEKVARFFAFDGNVMACSTIEADDNIADVIVLPFEFCSQLVALAKTKGASTAVSLSDKYALAEVTLPLGKVSLFSKLIDCPQPLDLTKRMRALRSDGKWAELPGLLDTVLTRAKLLYAENKGATTITIKDDGRGLLYTKSDHGEIKDPIVLAGHAPIEVKTDAHKLHKGVEQCSEIMLTERCIMLRDDDGFQYFVAVLA